jgi:hypothetical protein
MFNLKKVLFAVIISCSIGTMSVYSTTAASASKSMRPNKEVAKDVVNSLKEALSAVENKESKETILDHIQNARQFSKEINVGSLGAMVDRGADAIVSSRRNVKNDDMDAAVVSLNLAIKTYNEMGKKTL